MSLPVISYHDMCCCKLVEVLTAAVKCLDTVKSNTGLVTNTYLALNAVVYINFLTQQVRVH